MASVTYENVTKAAYVHSRAEFPTLEAAQAALEEQIEELPPWYYVTVFPPLRADGTEVEDEETD